MIKLIANMFKTKEGFDKSTVEIEVDIPEKTKDDLFDDAVKEVVERELRIKVKATLTAMCYSKEQIIQTDKVIKRFGGALSPEDYSKAKIEYPLVEFEPRFGEALFLNSYCVKSNFDIDLLVDRIINGELNENL